MDRIRPDFKKIKTIVFIIVAVVLTIVFISAKGKIEKISYSQFVSYLEDSEVSKIKILEASGIAEITLTNGNKAKVTIATSESVTDLVTEYVKEGQQVELTISKKTSAGKSVAKVFEAIIFMGFAFYLLGRFNPEGSFTSLVNGGSTGLLEEVSSGVRFTDVAGIEEEKGQLIDIVNFLKEPQEYQKRGAKLPKGILLTGDPGTGKTLLAKAIAGEAGVPFFQISGSSFDEVYVGIGSSRVRTLFAKAKKRAPAIIFIDEIDVVAQKRYRNGKNDYGQTLNQLLAQMDGFTANDAVIVLAATNHPEVLDEAITRPGRFDRKIRIPMPDVCARYNILQVHSKTRVFSEEVDLEEIAHKTIGFSGADLENLLNEAAIIATNRKADYITLQDIDEAFARITVGLEKKDTKMSKEERHATAIHEAGHAVCSAACRSDVGILSISIIPRGSTLGYNMLNEAEKLNKTEQDFLADIITLYGGRAAEEVILKTMSSGASRDLKDASKKAFNMVNRFALTDGLLNTLTDSNGDYDAYLVRDNMATVKKVCKDAYEKAKEIIQNNRDLLEKLAKLLEEKEVLSALEITEFFKNETIVRI